MTQNNWTWSDKEDKFLYEHGTRVAIAIGRSKAIQKFVEALSYKIGAKCDFAFIAGRAHIDVHPDFANKAVQALNDKEFMAKFLVPYSETTYENETYFEIAK